jgi:anhydro-N-acetylmuramic acid kinase
VLGGHGAPVASVERDLTLAHIAAVNALIARHAIAGIELIGFHGHTILHQLRTWQIGVGSQLASSTGIDLGGDFRSADVAAGGEGAAFAPLYQAALASPLDKPLALLNLGAVGNVIRIGSRAIDIVAFGHRSRQCADRRLGACPYRAGPPVDRAGRRRAARCRPSRPLSCSPLLRQPPPKSLERDDFAGFLPRRRWRGDLDGDDRGRG